MQTPSIVTHTCDNIYKNSDKSCSNNVMVVVVLMLMMMMMMMAVKAAILTSIRRMNE
jgi:hypothetical protein